MPERWMGKQAFNLLKRQKVNSMKSSRKMALAVIAGLSVSGSCLAGEGVDKKIAQPHRLLSV